MIKYICINVGLQFLENVTDASAIYEANTVAVFPLNENVCLQHRTNLKKWAKQALMSCSNSSRHMERLRQLWQSEPKRGRRKR